MAVALAAFGYVALLALLQVAFLGEAGVPNAGLHPAVTRQTVIWGRLALFMLLLPLLFVGVWP